jgi:hypothetical protein
MVYFALVQENLNSIVGTASYSKALILLLGLLHIFDKMSHQGKDEKQQQNGPK